MCRLTVLACLLSLVVLIAAPWGVAQELQLDQLEFQDAQLHLAGPDSFYLRGVGMGARTVSMLIQTVDGRTWEVSRVFDESENIVPDGMILDFATATRVGDRRIRVEGLFLDGTAYGGTLSVARDGNITPVFGSFAESDPTLYSADRGDPLLELIMDVAGLRAAEQELAALRAERDALAAGEVGLAMENERLEKERELLLERINQLDLENQELSRQLALLVAAGDGAPEAADGKDSDADTHGPDGPEAASGDYQQLTDEIIRLAEEIGRLRRALAQGTRESSDADTVDAEIARLRQENDRLRERLMAESYEAFAVDSTTGFVTMAKSQLTEVLLTGFSQGESHIGRWQTEANRAVQGDSEQFFAKLTLPVTNGGKATLYEFSAKSLDTGWVGLGMHIEVSGVELRGYGLGRSMLIWLTRDRDAYGHELTHLQVYRSDDDVNMGRVAEAVIPEVLSEFQRVEILYEPHTEYITVAIDGVDRLRYSTWFDLEHGVQIALRSLGAAEFRDLRVTTVP